MKSSSSYGGEKWSTGRERDTMSEKTRSQASCFMVSKDNYKTTSTSGGCQSEVLVDCLLLPPIQHKRAMGHILGLSST